MTSSDPGPTTGPADRQRAVGASEPAPPSPPALDQAASAIADARDRRQLRGQALGFGIGSVLFGLGAVLALAQVAEAAVNPSYAIGAVFFTGAAMLQLRSALDHMPQTEERRAWALLRDPDLMASGIQLVGTIEFNVMTIRAVVLPFSDATYTEIWRPDVAGSAMFLISSWIAWHPIARKRRHRLVHGRSRAILVGNMLGSIFFAISAWGSMLVDGAFQSTLWANLGTLLGAVGFLVAAVLLWPPRARR